jgi:hypothetical protein
VPQRLACSTGGFVEDQRRIVLKQDRHAREQFGIWKNPALCEGNEIPELDQLSASRRTPGRSALSANKDLPVSKSPPNLSHRHLPPGQQ